MGALGEVYFVDTTFRDGNASLWVGSCSPEGLRWGFAGQMANMWLVVYMS